MQFLNAVLLLRVMRGFEWFVFASKCRRPAQRFGRSMKKGINGNGKVASRLKLGCRRPGSGVAALTLTSTLRLTLTLAL